MLEMERELLINLTLGEDYNNYINFMDSLENRVEDKDNIIDFLRRSLNKDLLVNIYKYNLNITLASNKIIFNKYKEEVPKNLGMDIEDFIIIPNIEDLANYTIKNLENFLEEEQGEIYISLESYNIDLFIYNTISYYYSDPYRKAIYNTIKTLREDISYFSNRIIELEEEIDILYIEYKEKDLGERNKSREEYYRELGKLNHKRRRLIDKIERLEERLEELEFIED